MCLKLSALCKFNFNWESLSNSTTLQKWRFIQGLPTAHRRLVAINTNIINLKCPPVTSKSKIFNMERCWYFPSLSGLYLISQPWSKLNIDFLLARISPHVWLWPALLSVAPDICLLHSLHHSLERRGCIALLTPVNPDSNQPLVVERLTLWDTSISDNNQYNIDPCWWITTSSQPVVYTAWERETSDRCLPQADATLQTPSSKASPLDWVGVKDSREWEYCYWQ